MSDHVESGKAGNGRPVRCLLLAEMANPEWASVPLVGWSMSQAIFEITDSHIVTQVRNRDAFIRAGLVEGRDFTAIDTERIMRPALRLSTALRGDKGLGWTLNTAMGSLTYPFFEKLVWRRFGAEIRAGKYDVVHRVVPLTPTAPSLMARRCAKAGVPFVVGPINGGVPWPRGFKDAQREEHEWLSNVRNLYKLQPGMRATYKYSAAVIVASRFTLDDLPKSFRDKYRYMPENGIDPQRFSVRAEPYSGGALRICFVGRLVPCKGVDMLIEAAAPLLLDGRAELDIIGDGPTRPRLEDLAARLRVSDFVRFHGWVRHERLQETMAHSQVLGFPSIREFGGGVVLEAMALGIVPIVVDYAGPAELVDDEVGFKVPLRSRESIVEGLRERMERLSGDPGLLAAMSAACLDRIAREYTWQRKAEQVVGIYRECMADLRAERRERTHR